MARDTTVFLVDDDAAVRDSLKLLLETHGLVVKDFDSGKALLQDHMPRAVDCLVCDIHMPVMSGIDLIETLARRGVSRPTILITGRVDAALRQRAQAAGAFLVLEKPFDGAQLIDAIDRAVEARN
jgi:two-component system, LuxR family, response regulator FixJ